MKIKNPVHGGEDVDRRDGVQHQGPHAHGVQGGQQRLEPLHPHTDVKEGDVQHDGRDADGQGGEIVVDDLGNAGKAGLQAAWSWWR